MGDVGTFNGFSQEGISFLFELAGNNEKDWFDTRKEIYQRELLAPAQALVAAVGARLQAEISPDIVYDTRANGSGSLMRIYRDTRFAKDKSPYKTNIGMIFWEGPRKKAENPSFGFQFGTFGAGLYAGLFGIPKDLVQPYREAVDDEKRGKALVDAIAAVEAAGDYKIEGEQSKRVPAGYDKDHPRSDLLRHKGIHVSSPQLTPELLLGPELVDEIVMHCTRMAPVQKWLVELGDVR